MLASNAHAVRCLFLALQAQEMDSVWSAIRTEIMTSKDANVVGAALSAVQSITASLAG
jgi:hypothetical protein